MTKLGEKVEKHHLSIMVQDDVFRAFKALCAIRNASISSQIEAMMREAIADLNAD